MKQGLDREIGRGLDSAVLGFGRKKLCAEAVQCIIFLGHLFMYMAVYFAFKIHASGPTWLAPLVYFE